MIEEAYVSFETARLLKEKGFNESCHAYYENNGTFRESYSAHAIRNITNPCFFGIAAPIQQMAMGWLREVHNLDIIAPPQFDNSKWTYSAIIFKLSIPLMEIRLNDNKDKKEEACESAIKYCLEYLI